MTLVTIFLCKQCTMTFDSFDVIYSEELDELICPYCFKPNLEETENYEI